MTSDLVPLPFFFREIEATGTVLLSNQCGAFSFLNNRDQLEQVITKKYTSVPSCKLDELIAKGFLCEPSTHATCGNLIASKQANRIQRSVSGPALFLVVPTLRCDHDCSYCQVSRVPVAKHGYDLSLATIDRILRIIGATKATEIKVEFQGGEPLLAFQFLKQFVARAHTLLSHKKCSFVVCTALGVLDDDIVMWAKEHDVFFSVSLDGPEHIHNRNRPSRHFEPFERVTQRIHLLREALGPDRVSCLATVTKDSLNSPREIVRTFFDLGLDSVFLRPLSPFGFASHKLEQIGYTARAFMDFFKLALDEVLRCNTNSIFIEETALIHLKKVFRPQESAFADLQSPSGYAFGALVFNYDGRVFGSDESRMLWESTKCEELVLGTLETAPGTLFTNQHAIALNADTFLCAAPGCDECAYQPYCGADPLYHLATQGDHIGDKSISFFCQLERQIFDYLFELYLTQPDAKRIFERWLPL